MELTFCTLRQKSIVNVVDGKDLGRIQDIGLTESGKVTGIFTSSGGGGFKGLLKGETLFIPWDKICKIGDDVILVSLGCDDHHPPQNNQKSD